MMDIFLAFLEMVYAFAWWYLEMGLVVATLLFLTDKASENPIDAPFRYWASLIITWPDLWYRAVCFVLCRLVETVRRAPGDIRRAIREQRS